MAVDTAAAVADNAASADRNAEFDLIVARADARAIVFKARDSIEIQLPRRHARACRGHPRLNDPESAKTWMAGTSPATT